MSDVPASVAALPFSTKALAAAIALAILIGVPLTAGPVFGISGVGALALYFICWWTTLFAVLPFGITSQVEDGTVVGGTEPGAPATISLMRKVGWTTLFGTLVYIAAAAVLDRILLI